MSDGIGMAPRAQEPESAMLAGMAAPLLAPPPPPPILVPDTPNPGSWFYDFNPATGNARATWNGEIVAPMGVGGVASFNGRTGIVTLQAGDVTGVGGALLASPAFTGVPTAPTAAVGTNTTQLATTAFVIGQAGAANPLVNAAAAVVGVSTSFSRQDHVHPQQVSYTLACTWSANNQVGGGSAGVAGSINFQAGVTTTVAAGTAPLQAQSTTNTPAYFYSNGGAGVGAMIVRTDTTTTALEIFLSGASTTVGSISNTGSAVVYNTTSDYRLKTLHGPADGSIIARLKVHDASFKSHKHHRYPMFLAHEVQEVAPFAVTGAKDAVHEKAIGPFKKGDIIPQQVDASKLVPALVAYCQALEARLEALEGAGRVVAGGFRKAGRRAPHRSAMPRLPK